MEKPEIRVWIFNNPIRGITEQLDYLVLSLKQLGYVVTISKYPSSSALNIIIENISEETFPELEAFYKSHSKRLAIVMTEHLEFLDNRVLFHGLPFSASSEYMHPLIRRSRLLHLLMARNYIRFFITLGDLPSLAGVNEMFNGIPILRLPFPDIPVVNREIVGDGGVPCDLVFSGMLTSYRRKILNEMSKRFNVQVINKPLSRRRRDAMNSSAKAVLNIPQDSYWSWVSSMRVMAAWRCGRPVINIAEKKLKGVLFDFCWNELDFSNCKENLGQILNDSSGLFKAQLKNYKDFISSDDNNAIEIQSALQAWALTENL